jgi:fatty-acyl-CoA synthase
MLRKFLSIEGKGELLPYNENSCNNINVLQVQIDPAYLGPQLLHSFNKVDIKALICSEFYKTNSCYQIVRTVIPELDNCPESGIELKCSKAPALKVLILMSEKYYR